MSLADLNLKGNPFEEISELWFPDVESVFVKTRGDYVLDEIVNESAAMEGSGLILLIGEKGFGKTTRLMRIRNFFTVREAFCSFNKAEPGVVSNLIRKVLIESINAEKSFVSRLKRKLGFPIYAKVEGLSDGSLSPTDAAEIVINSFKTNFPAAILIDDLQNIYFSSAEWRFYLIEMLRHLVSSMPEGVLFVLAVTPQAYELLERDYSAFTSRIHTFMEVNPFNVDEALAFTQKRLARLRIHPTGDALFPFNEEIIERANNFSKGIPLELMRVLNLCIEIALRKRIAKVTEEVFNAFLYLEEPIEELGDLPYTLKRELRLLFNTFQNEQFTLEQAAVVMGIPLEKEFFRIEELADMDIIHRKGRMYRINPDIVEQINRRRIEVLG